MAALIADAVDVLAGAAGGLRGAWSDADLAELDRTATWTVLQETKCRACGKNSKYFQEEDYLDDVFIYEAGDDHEYYELGEDESSRDFPECDGDDAEFHEENDEGQDGVDGQGSHDQPENTKAALAAARSSAICWSFWAMLNSFLVTRSR